MNTTHDKSPRETTAGSEAPVTVNFKGVTKQYGTSTIALKPLTLTVGQGEIFGFLGPNGAGKTTTIRLMIDLIRPTHGNIALFGLDSHAYSLEIRQRIGYLPGELSLYNHMTSLKLLRMFAQMRSRQISWEYVHSLCNRLDVDLSMPIGIMSHGNRQKVGIVIALMARSELLILDEPTTSLDPILQNAVIKMLQEARADGSTIFFSSHILSEVEQICDFVGFIRQGELVAVEGIQALKSRRVQHVQIQFSNPVPRTTFAAIPGVHLLNWTPSWVELEVTGEMDPIIKAVASHHVVTLNSEQPSLEEVFLAHYDPSPHESSNE